MKTVLLLSNHHLYTYNLRKELIQKLINNDYRVVIALPYGEKVELLKEMGCEFINVPLIRRGTNPINELKLLFSYLKILRDVKPDIVLTYTLKPNLYGGLACRLNGLKVLHTVTGLGTVFIRNVLYKKVIIWLNRIAFKNSDLIVFMNEDNREFYKNLKIIHTDQKTKIVAGSGVNLDKFKYNELKKNSHEELKFTFIGRILKDKGIEEFLSAAKEVKKKYNNVSFEVVGFVDEDRYIKMLNFYEEKGIINYLGKRDDIPDIIASSSCIVLPSYGEGRGTVLQEGAAVGRPLITTNTYGCKDNVEDGYNGFLCEVADARSLINAMEKFIKLKPEQRITMGRNSRLKAEKEFNRQVIIDIYLNEIEKILSKIN